MLRLKILPVLVLSATFLFGQDETRLIEGKVTFTTSRNVYVRFDNTADIAVGDTLRWSVDGALLPCLAVTQKSSTSCVCTILNDCEVKVDDFIFFEYMPPAKAPTLSASNSTSKSTLPPPKNPVVTRTANSTNKPGPQEEIRGRISAASYSNLSASGDARHRMMYRLSINANNISNSKFSLETYLNYRENIITSTEPITQQPTRFFRVYNLAARYDVDSTMSVVLGRSINNKISSLGAIDGLQVEKWVGKNYIGGIVGFRPDIQAFGFNTDLFQYGAYVGRTVSSQAVHAQSALGVLEQRNAGQIDRRYVYFQHSSSFGHRLNLFGSMELDIYDRINEVASNNARLTNLYVSARYRFSRKINIAVAYDTRKRIIFYETLRTEIERLLANDESRQGLRFRVNVRPIKYLSVGVSIGRRFQSSLQNKSDNINGFASWSRVPKIGGRLTLSYNSNTSNYLRSQIYALRHSRTLLERKLNADFYYRMVNYHFFDDRLKTSAHYAGSGLTYRINRQLMCSVLGEYAIKPTDNTFRINFRIIKRFGSK